MNPRTLYAVYDLAVGPVSYDFVVFGIQAEIERQRIGARELHFVFIPDPKGPGGFRDKSHLYDQHEAAWRFFNICIPACAALRATHSLAADLDTARSICETRGALGAVWPLDWDHQTLAKRHHLIGGVVRYARAGIRIPCLQASVHARRKVARHFASYGRPAVTLTVRSTYMSERNLDVSQLSALIDHIERIGFAVKMIYDTDTALTLGMGYGELNLDLRLACYQEAVINLQSNNGTASLCWFSEKPYLMFDAGVPEAEWNNLFVEQGVPLGQDWPWAREHQHLVYGKANARKMIEELTKLCASMRKSK